MELLNKIIKKTRPNVYKAVKKEVLYFQDEIVGSQDQIIQDEIFRLIEDIEGLDLLLFPIEDDELCGFICNYKGQNFMYINTYLPYEKQIFAAAHELYHHQKNGTKELLHTDTIEESEELEDRKANLFAALLLAPDKALQRQLELLKVTKSSDITELKIVKLMNIFAVPYKTMVLRLYEIDLIDLDEAKMWLNISDRNHQEGILYLIKKHKIGERWQKRTKTVKYSNLKALIYDNDEMELLPEEKIKNDLFFINQDDVDEQ